MKSKTKSKEKSKEHTGGISN